MANTKITSKVIKDANVLTAAIADNAVTGAKVADDVALAGNPTTTTQSAGNNTTRLATTAFVSTAVSNLVASAPSALDTLNELAAAMGDDANFSTTVTNSIAAKLPLAGGTMTGALAMSPSSGTAKITFTSQGAGSEVFSVNGQIPGVDNAGFAIRNETDSRNDVQIDAGGNTTFSGDVKVLDSKGVRVGTDQDFSIYNDNSNTYLRNSTSNQDIIFLVNDDGSANTQVLKLDASARGQAAFGHGSGATATSNSVALFEGNDNTEVSILGGSSSVLALNFGHSGDNDEGKITFNTTANSEDLQLVSSKDITLVGGGVIRTNRALHVNPDGNTSKDTFRFTSNASFDAALLMNADTTLKVNIQANGASYFNGGSVGIGKTPDANLHVYSAGQAIARVEGANQYYSGVMIRNNYSSVQSQWHVAAAGGTSGWGAANGNFIVRDDTTNSTAFEAEKGAGGSTGAVYVQSTGTTTLNGIYSTTNAVNNVLRLNTSSSGTAVVGHGTGIQFLGERNDGNAQTLALIQAVTVTNSGTSIAADLTFHAGSGGAPEQALRLSYDKKAYFYGDTEVRSGTTSYLRVSGGSNTNNKVEIGYDNSDGPYIKGGSSGQVGLKLYYDNTTLGAKLHTDGDWYTNDGSVSALASDSRVKSNVTTLTDGIDIVKQLRPVTYKYNSKSEFYTARDDTTTRYGFVADEVKTVAPQYTSTGEGKVDGVAVSDFKTLSATKMIPMLVKAIQEQQVIIDSLIARIETLEG
jgi:hypothetical protein